MSEQLTRVLSEYADAFHERIPAERHNRFVQIVTLRETKSHAIFTTEGKTLDMERLQAGVLATRPMDRVLMYKRKQIAPERRNGKALLRSTGLLTEVVIGQDRAGKSITRNRAECQIMGKSCGYCPDCILYGYAATTGTGSQKSRVFSDSGFTVRSRSQIMRDIKLNAIADTTAGGIAGSAFNSRENLLPQVFLPMVETLLDVTIPEFVYVLGNLLKTTRYGAESSREGFVRNHLLGVYFSDTELFSNLELTQFYYDRLSSDAGNTLPDYLGIADFTAHWPQVEQQALAGVIGRYRTLHDLAGLLEGMRALYADEEALRALLTALTEEALRYARDVKSRMGRGGRAAQAEGEEIEGSKEEESIGDEAELEDS